MPTLRCKRSELIAQPHQLAWVGARCHGHKTQASVCENPSSPTNKAGRTADRTAKGAGGSLRGHGDTAPLLGGDPRGDPALRAAGRRRWAAFGGRRWAAFGSVRRRSAAALAHPRRGGGRGAGGGGRALGRARPGAARRAMRFLR